VTLQRLTGAYRAAAIILLNTIVVFIAVNVLGAVIVGVISVVAHQRDEAPSGTLFKPDGAPVNNHRRSPGQLRHFDYGACNELEPSYVGDVLDDFFDLRNKGLPYQAWVQFAEPPFRGKRVSVQADELGVPFRGTNSPSAQPSARVVRIYVFGGSTTFGYQVSDEHTWPSHLSTILNERSRREGLDIRIDVRNYGRGFYYPSQEVALLVDLLRSGHRPDLVIFLDGLNVGFFQDVPQFSARTERAVHAVQHARSDWSTLKSLQLSWLPAWRLAKWFRRAPETAEDDEAAEEPTPGDPTPAETRDMTALLARRFHENWKIAKRVAALYGVETLVFIQPNAVMNYPLELYRTAASARFLRARKLAASLYDELRRGGQGVYLGDLFQEWGQRKALVDRVHYSPRFNAFLARRISSHIDLASLKGSVSSATIDPGSATGLSRAGGAPTRSPLL
jgi:hypothetical protein